LPESAFDIKTIFWQDFLVDGGVIKDFDEFLGIFWRFI
jgi:hypothetical protein